MPTPDVSFWYFQARDMVNFMILITTIAAIVVGPVLAVKVARENDEKREARRRKFEIFHSLMKTRRFVLDPQHVMALNLIPVEFYGNEKVDAAYRAYIAALSRPVPQPDAPGVDHFFGEQEDLLYDLIHAVGAELDYNYDKRDLKKFAYSPQGWQNDETQIRVFRHLLIEVLTGKRGFPCVDFAKAAQWSDKFPAPPPPTEQLEVFPKKKAVS